VNRKSFNSVYVFWRGRSLPFLLVCLSFFGSGLLFKMDMVKIFVRATVAYLRFSSETAKKTF
jgi:uncharacterized integral membrane protein